MDVVTDIPALIRIGDLARLTGAPISYLRRLAEEGLVPAYRVGPGRHRRFRGDEAVRRIYEILKIRA